jgi:hypothetical protein
MVGRIRQNLFLEENKQRKESPRIALAPKGSVYGGSVNSGQKHAEVGTRSKKEMYNFVDALTAKFFFIALFCSIYRSRIRLQAILKLGHLSIRRMRQVLFASGGCDSAVDEAAGACMLLLYPPDTIGGF